ncbi:MAG TPA: murein L,D-transpeptidase catalytic domain family protein [Chitinophagaceae bacterium]|nr:murein L,D-transpeptidase catalytic domain family protein [Chitinophagaceae bacterium]
MKKIVFPFLVSCISFSFTLIPSDPAGLPTPDRMVVTGLRVPDPGTALTGLIESAATRLADYYYDSIQLDRYGLSRAAMEYAIRGYQHLLQKGYIDNPDVLTICDFSLSSRRKRMFLIDLKNYKLILNTYVAHGRRSGGEYANRFSNRPNSHESSLGFYVTRNTYFGDHGLALKIQGVDRGFNDRAGARNIVVHGSDYVGEDFLETNQFLGRSFGCPAVPREETETVINTIKGGTCFFIYHPTKKYLAHSKILNG